MKFNKGDRVMLRLTLDESTSMLAPFNGGFYRISKVHHVKSLRVYELEGVESAYGIPYTIHDEWIQLVEDVPPEEMSIRNEVEW